MPMMMTVWPGSHLGRVDGRAPAGADAAADEAGLLQRQVLVDLHARRRRRRRCPRRTSRCRRPGRSAGRRCSCGSCRRGGSRSARWRRGRTGSACPTRTSGSGRSRAGTTARRGRRPPSRACSGRPPTRCRRPRGRRPSGRMPGGRSPVVMWSSEWHRPGGHHLQLHLALARLLHVDLEDLPLARRRPHDRTTCLHREPPIQAAHAAAPAASAITCRTLRRSGSRRRRPAPTAPATSSPAWRRRRRRRTRGRWRLWTTRDRRRSTPPLTHRIHPPPSLTHRRALTAYRQQVFHSARSRGSDDWKIQFPPVLVPPATIEKGCM